MTDDEIRAHDAAVKQRVAAALRAEYEASVAAAARAASPTPPPTCPACLRPMPPDGER